MFWLLCVWLRSVCNWLGVFWNRGGPRRAHSRAGAGRRPQCDPDGVGVRAGQPSGPRGGLRGHWQGCRYPSIYPQTHRWYRVSSGIMLLLLGLSCWQAPAKPCLKPAEIISDASSNDSAPVFCQLQLLSGGRTELLSSLPWTGAETIFLPILLLLFWRGKTACSYSELWNFSCLVRDTHGWPPEYLLLFQSCLWLSIFCMWAWIWIVQNFWE